MTTDEAITICEQWFRHNDRQRSKTVEMQRLARLANTEPEEARRQLRQLDRQPRVFDGARLEPAVRHLVSIVQEGL